MTNTTPDPAAIPAELKERSQWLMWDGEADTPRRPHWRGDFGVSWSDPDDWHSFDEADEAAGDRESWGVGYVFAVDNDDHARGIYGCLDLDGCVDEDGRPKDWLPSLQPFFDRDAYIEFSPSGEGIHIPIAGFEPPEWWADQHFSDDEHEGVEALTNKFCTFTGDALEGSGETVVDYGDWVDDWLREAYTAITGEDPVETDDSELENYSDGDGTPANRDEWMGEADVRAALDHIDPDVDYATWRDIGFALEDFFSSTSTAKRVFKDWSRGGRKWDDDAEDYAERIIEDGGSGRGRRTIGTVVHHAKRGGWDPSTAPSATTSKRERAATDGAGATAASTSDAGPDPADALHPSTIRVLAGLGEDDTIGDLNDRQKAAHIWQAIRDSNKVHVRVHRENDELWAFDPETGTWNANGERALRHAARQALTPTNYGGNVLEELKTQARADPTAEVFADDLGLEPGQVAVENGLLDLESAAAVLTSDGDPGDALREIEPEDYAQTRLPVEYDPDADGDEWRQFVDEVVEDEMIDAVQEYTGYCLHRDHIFDRSMLFVGGGANGKSTFLNVLEELLGDENTANCSPYNFGDKPSLAELQGTLANISADLAGGSLQGKNLGNFKKLTGGDTLTAKRLYKNPFRFTYDGGMLFAANEVPDVPVSDDDAAFWRRWIIVHFDNHFPEGSEKRDPTLEDRLKEPEALSAVLNWAIEGWARLLDQGAFTNVPSTADETRRKWQKWGDSLDTFTADCVYRDEDADRLTTGEAYQRYLTWCRENGHDSVGRQKFTMAMKDEDVGYSNSLWINGRSARGYNSLGFTAEVPDPDADEDADDDDSSPTDRGLDEFEGEGDDADRDDDRDQNDDRPPNGEVRDAILEGVDQCADERGQARRAHVLLHVRDEIDAPADQVLHVLENDLLADGALMEPETGTLERT